VSGLNSDGELLKHMKNRNRQTPSPLKTDVRQSRKRTGKRSEPFHRGSPKHRKIAST
jgi:hypothetical protein